ncbi:MAG: hypothetical protein JOZ89_07185 [Gammaproteobacteria bacterium]|nr:hypothetical protein [Gammaproteobacteria bacterium]
MTETIGSHLRRRYRWALSGVIGGALGALLAESLIGTREAGEALAFQGASAVVWAGALLVAARTRCPRCHRLFADRISKIIPMMLLFALGTPAGRCPRCGASLNERCP